MVDRWFLCGYEKLGSCWSYRRYNTLRGTGRYVINIHKRRNGAVVDDEEARGRASGSQAGAKSYV